VQELEEHLFKTLNYLAPLFKSLSAWKVDKNFNLLWDNEAFVAALSMRVAVGGLLLRRGLLLQLACAL
jgi:hypothetical protein